MPTFSGLKIVVLDPYPVEVRRTWRERLLSIPWRPWTRVRTEYREVIDSGAVMHGDTLYMRRADFYELKQVVPTNTRIPRP